MKKCFTILLLTLYTLTADAQLGPTAQQQDHNLYGGFSGPNAGFGLKGGVNFAEINGSDKAMLGDIDGYTSFHAGIFAQLALSNFFSIQSELLYSRKGYERTDSTFRFDYLELPVLAVFNLTDNISIHLGPQIGTMVSAKQEGKEVNLDRFNTFDYGVAAGLEARISRFRLGGRYNLGFADVIKTNAAGQNVTSDIKQGVLQVYLGVGF
ncbi:porin family protein [uncultured Pontibacter sp.]|uniref:porin family protein n=1 Tax=uncultured Pontibacter sp. TaxID=453356 RepID=UPI002615D66E|nr:porin family protein [uncultured Pontibacter sp.]